MNSSAVDPIFDLSALQKSTSGQLHPPHIVFDYRQSKNTDRDTVIVMTPSHNALVINDPDPLRDSMAISMTSIFFCCFLGLFATLKASQAYDRLRRGDMEAANDAAESARKIAVTAIFVGVFFWFLLLLINAFFIKAGNYKGVRYGHVHTHYHYKTE